jgi:hypothetical protein
MTSPSASARGEVMLRAKRIESAFRRLTESYRIVGKQELEAFGKAHSVPTSC